MAVTTNPAQMVSAQRAYIYLAPVGTAAPVDVTADLASPWKNVGLTTPDSLAFSTSPEFETIQSHQSDYETRRIQSTDSATLKVDLQQWNTDNFQAVYGGGDVAETSTGSGVYKFTPPKLGARTEKACVVEIIDGTKKYRWVYPRTLQVEGVELALQKGQGANLTLSLAILGGDDTDAWYLLSNDAAFAPAAA